MLTAWFLGGHAQLCTTISVYYSKGLKITDLNFMLIIVALLNTWRAKLFSYVIWPVYIK